MDSGYFGDPNFGNNERSGGSSRKGKKSSSDKPKQPQRGLGVAQLEKIRLHGQMGCNYHPSLHSTPPYPTTFNPQVSLSLFPAPPLSRLVRIYIIKLSFYRVCRILWSVNLIYKYVHAGRYKSANRLFISTILLLFLFFISSSNLGFLWIPPHHGIETCFPFFNYSFIESITLAKSRSSQNYIWIHILNGKSIACVSIYTYPHFTQLCILNDFDVD